MDAHIIVLMPVPCNENDKEEGEAELRHNDLRRQIEQIEQSPGATSIRGVAFSKTSSYARLNDNWSQRKAYPIWWISRRTNMLAFHLSLPKLSVFRCRVRRKPYISHAAGGTRRIKQCRVDMERGICTTRLASAC